MQDYLTDLEAGRVAYGKFPQRLAAIVLDFLFLSPFTYLLSYLNRSNWKNPFVLLIIYAISILYKPLMEIQYGATLGKMIVRLKVVNKNFEHAPFVSIVLRNIFSIVYKLAAFFSAYSILNSVPVHVKPSQMPIFSTAVIAELALSSTYCLIVLVDIIFLLTDEQSRSLHDRIGKTLVIIRDK